MAGSLGITAFFSQRIAEMTWRKSHKKARTVEVVAASRIQKERNLLEDHLTNGQRGTSEGRWLRLQKKTPMGACDYIGFLIIRLCGKKKPSMQLYKVGPAVG